MPRTREASNLIFSKPQALTVPKILTRFSPASGQREQAFSSAAFSISSPRLSVSSTSFFAPSAPNASESSFSTPSAPILSSLSKVTNTLSKSFSQKPQGRASAFNNRLSLTLTQKSGKPSFSKASPVASMSSVSARKDSSLIISMSHCTN